jgi:hypothetical protein
VIDRAFAVEAFAVEELLDHAQVHFRIVGTERVVETTFRKTHVERHLAAFKSVDRNTGTGFLAFLATSAGFAFARANAPANTHARLARAFIVFKFVEFHVVYSLSLLFARKC